MNRPIKFRAWDGKKMIDLYAITPLAVDEKLYSSLQHAGLFLPFSDDIIFMQFTGLLDSKGVECFEGDIIKNEEGKTSALGIVRFGKHYVGYDSDLAAVSVAAGFYMEGIEVKGKFLDRELSKNYTMGESIEGEKFGLSSEFEIIGNIFEHPYLLNHDV